MNELISAVLIIVTLFTVVFFKMEIRRLEYQLYRHQKVYSQKVDRFREAKLQLAGLMKPDYVRDYAKSLLTLDWADKDQIIYLANGREVATPKPSPQEKAP